MDTVSRREFLKYMNAGLATIGVMVVAGPVAAFFYPPNTAEAPAEPVRVGAVEDLPVGTSKTVAFGRYPALVINTPQGMRAYSAVCTHFACIVMWDPDLGQIMCPCHAAFFDPLDGSVISGPPPSGLEALAVEVKDGQIYVGSEA
jgi:Rieske Fe-S protein